MRTRNLVSLALAVGMLLVVVGTARADTIPFTFSFTATSGSETYVGEGTLNATTGAGFDGLGIDSGTLTLTGGTLAGSYNLQPSNAGYTDTYSPFGVFLYDNRLFPSSTPQIDGSGLLFVKPGVEVNLWGNGPGSYTFYGWTAGAGGYYPQTTFTSLSLVPVPEPATLSLLGLGLVGLVRVRRRRP